MKTWPLWLVYALLASCGFHLRGMIDMANWLNNIAIVTEAAHHDLAPKIKKQLQAYGINIIADPTHADYVLILEKDFTTQQLTNVAASTVPRQYQMTYRIQYSLIKVNGQQLPLSTNGASSRSITITRQLTINNDRVLGSDFEGGVIMSEMHREAAMQLISRLSRK